jgi:glycosyltransferase involved in cell wall biosynthesis
MTPLRILWLSHFVPYPPKGGCFQRSYNLIAQTGRRHAVDLIAMRPKAAANPNADAEARAALLEHCRSVSIVDISAATRPAAMARRAAASLVTARSLTVSLFDSPEMRRLVRAAVPQADVVHLDSISLADYVADAGGKPTLMTHHGAESFMIRRRIAKEPSLARKAFFAVEWLTLQRAERRACPRVGVNVVMSALDGQIMQATAPARYEVVENGVDVGFFAPLPVAGGTSIVFAGRLDQYSNRDGILHFMDQTWPRVVARHPDARITIVGSGPPERLRELAAQDPRIEVTGFVDDVRPYFARATVAICPIRDGGGTRIKVLDALAQAKPLVATTIGCEGLEVTPDRDVLIGDTPETFASQIGRVFDVAGLRASLAREGRATAERVYSWEHAGGKLSALYEGLARGAAQPSSAPVEAAS